MQIFSEKAKFYLKNLSLLGWMKKGFNEDFYQQLTLPYFARFNFDTIIDIGANEGQSAFTFRLAFPNAAIYAFEPLPECFAKLEANLSRTPNMFLHNLAIGDKSGDLVFEQNEYAVSSSALPMSDKHIDNFPQTRNRKQIKVPVQTLDQLFAHREDLGNVFIKIDVQGYEKHVIAGGPQTLSKTQALIVETSFDTLYEGQPLFGEIYETVRALGFSYAGSIEQLVSPQTGEVLQQDTLFVRSPK